MDLGIGKARSREGYVWSKVLIVLFVGLVAMQLITTIPWLAVKRGVMVAPGSKLLDESVDYNDMIADGRAASLIAAALGRDPWARNHLRGSLGLNLVGSAALYGRSRVLKMLLARGAPAEGAVDFRYGLNAEPDQTTPLDQAVISDQPGAAKILLAAGADPYERCSIGHGMGAHTPYRDAVILKERKIIAMFKAFRPPFKNEVRASATRP